MELNLSTLAAGFVYGVIGVYLVKEGKRTAHIPWILVGVAMLVYPYFVSGPWLTWGIGLALVAAARLWS